jgi:hypothetical protein
LTIEASRKEDRGMRRRGQEGGRGGEEEARERRRWMRETG